MEITVFDVDGERMVRLKPTRPLEFPLETVLPYDTPDDVANARGIVANREEYRHNREREIRELKRAQTSAKRARRAS